MTSLRPQVLHHFFFERWEHPSAWFEHRLAYSRSLGSSTIVGFLLGLGDRHCSNILLDQRSAELVHIDLGIAFDKGQLLKTPERVPFRLTRDVVDVWGGRGSPIYDEFTNVMVQVSSRTQPALAYWLASLLAD